MPRGLKVCASSRMLRSECPLYILCTLYVLRTLYSRSDATSTMEAGEALEGGGDELICSYGRDDSICYGVVYGILRTSLGGMRY